MLINTGSEEGNEYRERHQRHLGNPRQIRTDQHVQECRVFTEHQGRRTHTSTDHRDSSWFFYLPTYKVSFYTYYYVNQAVSGGC